MTKARNIADIGSNDVLDTDANGVDVTGSITAETAVLSGTAPVLSYSDTDNSITAQIGSGGSDFNIETTSSHNLDIRTNSTRRMIVANNGDITMYKDDGSTAGFEYDASTANVTVNGDIKLTETGDTTQSLTFQQVGGASFIKPKSGSNDGELYISGGQTATNRMKITTGGDIIMYKDDGSSIGFKWDASTNKVIIGVDSSNDRGTLTVTDSKTITSSNFRDFPIIALENNTNLEDCVQTFIGNYAGSNRYGNIIFSPDVTQALSYFNIGGPIQQATSARFYGNGDIVFNESGQNYDFRVESDGNTNMLLVDGGNNYVSFGTNATDIGSSSSGEGVTYRNGESLRVQRASGSPIIANRVTDDGSIIDFRKNGAGVGSVGVDSGKLTLNSGGSNLVLQTGGTSRVNIDSTQMYPQTNGAMNLGHPSVKWGDLLLDSEAKVDGSVNINTSTNVGRINVAGTVSNGIQVFMQHNECMVIGAMSGGASGPTLHATISFESQHLRAMTIEMESSGHKYNNGADKWHTRHVYSVMSESGSTRFNQRLSNLEFAIGSNRMTTTVTKVSGSNLWTARISFSGEYQGAFHFRMLGYGVANAPTSFVYS